MVESVCSYYYSAFPIKTFIHKHFNGYNMRSTQSYPSLNFLLPAKSTLLTSDIETRFGFCGWSYVSILVILMLKPLPDIVNFDACRCLNTSCAVTLIDRRWLACLLPDQPINKIATLLSMRSIGFSKHKTDEYVCAPLYLIGTKNDNWPAYAFFHRELHLIDSLKANILIGNNIISSEGILIDISKRLAYISSCGIKLKVDAK